MFLCSKDTNVKKWFAEPVYTRNHITAEIIQENHYYPFGMTLGGLDYYSALYNDYLYQGKELQKDGFDLQGGDDVLDTKLLWHDFHARFYDAQLGRFHVPDPIINEASPYVGMMNNPVIITDPSGMTPGGDDKYKDHPSKSKVIDDNQGWSIDFGVIIDWFKSWWAGGSGNNSGSSSFGNWRDDFSYDLENYSGETYGSNTFHGTGTNGGIFYTSTSNGGGAYFWLIALGIDVDWYLAEGRKTALRKEINKIKPLIAKTASYNRPVIDAPPERPHSTSVRLANESPQFINQGGTYSIDKAVNWLNDNAHSSWNDSEGKCGTYIRWGIEAGFGLDKDALKGNTTDQTGYAKNMGPYLQELGFQSISTTSFLKGDIAVIQNFEGGSAAGHVQMFNGDIWISDFKQYRDFWPGSGYREKQPSFSIYRYQVILP